MMIEKKVEKKKVRKVETVKKEVKRSG